MERTYKTININKNDIIKKDYFRIPKYQRNLVWSKKKKYELINSIIKGFPIGVILINEENGKYNIIDGLQRITTLKDFYKNPNKYLRHNDDLNDLFDKKEWTEDEKDKLFKIIDNEKKLSKSEIGSEINAYLKDINRKDDLVKLDEIIEETQSILNDIEIIAINYQGDAANLPTIFERLNSNGTQLSKFDIYAASWTHNTVEIDKDEIKEQINKRYENMYKNSDIDVIFDANEYEYNVFDYGYGLGKYLSSKYPFLFNDKDNYVVPSHGFYILSLLFFKNVSSISKLGKEISSKTKDEINAAFNKIIDVIDIVNEALKITSKNFLTNSALNPHTDYQLYSIIGYVLKKGRKLDKELFKMYAWKHVYLDLIKNYWSGSGDSKVKTILESSKTTYEVDIETDTAREIIKEYINSENSTVNKGNISNLNRLTLSLLFKNSNAYNDSGRYDVEHIVPRDKFNNNNFAIGSVANMTFMKNFDNRSKKTKTVWQEKEIMKENSDFFNIDEQKIIDEYYYPSKSELNFVHANEITEQNYENFLKIRSKLIESKILDFLKK